jgi:hypothetical protein
MSINDRRKEKKKRTDMKFVLSRGIERGAER